MGYSELLAEYAKEMAIEHTIFYLEYKPDNILKFSKENQKRLKALRKKLYPYSYNVTFAGFCLDEDISHYTIDMCLDKEFGDDIITDSESTQFFAHCHPNSKKVVAEFLKTRFPDLSFVFDSNDGDVFEIIHLKDINSWDDAIKYCNDNNIDYSIPEVVIPEDEQVKIQIRQILAKEFGYVDKSRHTKIADEIYKLFQSSSSQR